MAVIGYRLAVDFGTTTATAVLVGPDGRATPLPVDGSPPLGGPDEAIVTLLDRVAAESRRLIGDVPAEVVLTHPASWGGDRLGVLVEAARRAGLGEARLVPAPVTAGAYTMDGRTATRPAARGGGLLIGLLVAAGAAMAMFVAAAVAVAVILWPESDPSEPRALATPSAATASADPRPTAEPTVGPGAGDVTELRVTTLFKGDGEPTRAGQSLTMHYIVALYGTGEEIDSSWYRGQPFTFVLGDGVVIPGLDQALVGVPVGSRLQVDVPARLAYGEKPAQGQPAGPLRFVIDVLSAQ